MGTGDGERLHSTVRLNQFTLQFEDPALEKVYQAGLHPRKKALWLRSLLPAAASQILFALADGLDFPVENLLVTVPTRVLIAMLQVAMWLLVRWDLVRAKEQTMLLVSVASGIPTLLLYALQRSSLCQWDAMFVTFGLSFYTIPKITPLGYVSSFYGSWTTAAVYTVLTFVARPPPRRAEGVLGIFFLVPMVWVFNTIAYYSEYNSRERFALRRRLRRESITLAVACTSAGGEALLQDGEEDGWLLLHTLSLRGLMAANSNSTASFIVAVILWGAFTLGGWASLPDALKFVDEATGWAWFSHCAGVTVFLLVMTRRLRWLLVVPVVGAFLLWVMSLAMPASWIIFSAHSVGYGLLLASVVVAMGVFGWFLCAWRELVSFLTRSCFLYPQLQAGMEREYPLLVRIVSEYTAGFDPEILSARVPTETAIELMGTTQSSETTAASPKTERSTTKPPPTRPALDRPQREKTKKTQLQTDSKKFKMSTPTQCKTSEATAAKDSTTSKQEGAVLPTDSFDRMVSVLPSFKPGKCFFCSKNEAEHFVPACGMWGKWTHWRMNQQHNMNNASIASASSGAAGAKSAVAVSMCTSYYDLQNDRSTLEARVQAEEQKSSALAKKLAACQEREQKLSLESVRLQAELHAMEEKHATELRRCEAHLQEKMEAVQKEANRSAHGRKLQAKKAEVAHSAALQKRLEVSERRVQETSALAQSAEEEATKLRSSLDQSGKDVIEWKTRAEELKKQVSSLELRLQQQQSTSQTRASPQFGPSALDFSFASTASGGSSLEVSPVAALQTLQPSGRLPYAQSLEIEGLRESSRHSKDDVDYSKRWRLLQTSDLSKSDGTP
ncbi:hypothetical protein PC129_g13817 [Phytophthora cactorum]|uniref:Uncharacterized protein n=1 Tax=Phytophthora cactorum TaxID=29920 RepID=A0A329RRG8_9STRA|nr:hypothetical protein Pcac1_g4893 [Phytophthora cactorum]KAG2806713.1 hypothetical protein PC112_g17726 [Phytophthora cactorum]KAG3021256.1 hypothetical protein PC119_g9671 [Phytophthora cactorum]KAG3141214.1 hypothetical protein C6341_g19831 [Phytophthora cactorum]KAG3215300.1 hypothetical protein PC129_g13817 [Phytophthora cactorum]